MYLRHCPPFDVAHLASEPSDARSRILGWQTGRSKPACAPNLTNSDEGNQKWSDVGSWQAFRYDVSEPPSRDPPEARSSRLERTLLRPISNLQHQSQLCASEPEMTFPQERYGIVHHLATTRTLGHPDGRLPPTTVQRGTTLLHVATATLTCIAPSRCLLTVNHVPC